VGDAVLTREVFVSYPDRVLVVRLTADKSPAGCLVTPFSMSPEHGYYDSKGQLAFLSPAPTVDVALIRELFPHCLEASKLLGVDEEFRARLGSWCPHRSAASRQAPAGCGPVGRPSRFRCRRDRP
jgi:alpha-L-fucosidase 2